jgi:carboxyl-terminal processing protease
MKMKRTVVAPALVAAVAMVSGGLFLQRGSAQEPVSFGSPRVFEEVLRYVSQRYVDPQQPAELYQKAVEGMLRELGDPHTSFLSAEEYNNLRISTTGEYGGLGMSIDERNGWVTVVAPLPGTPAERAGVRAGDRIIEIEGQSARGLTSDQAVKVLRGPKGTPVNIRIARFGVEEPIAFRLVREEIHVQSVPYAYMVSEGVGLIKLNVFSETSTSEIRTAAERLRRQGMTRLVLDLRTNPGGLLDQGVSVSDLFLQRGDAIVETRTRDPREAETFRARSGELLANVPMVVLVNGYSASAAEIVAGALQDHDRALVLGTTTFGKGSVQTLFPLSGGNFLKMTTGRWYTPVGRSIQKERTPGDPMTDVADVVVSDEGVPIPSADSIAADTAQRQSFRTDGGRVVYGGGGIVPDLLVRQDTATLAEQEFFRAASKSGRGFYDVLFRYAVEYSRSQPNLARDFTVTPAMRAELFRRLREAGVEVTQPQFEGAQNFVSLQLAQEIAQARFGPAVAAERANANDSVVRTAVELLRAAPNQQALFRSAEVRRRTALR